MNCTRCDRPLEPGARFCRNCGLVAPPPLPSDTIIDRTPAYQPQSIGAQATIQPQAPVYQPTQPALPQATPVAENMRPQTLAARGRTRRRHRSGCAAGCVVLLVVLLVVVGVGWIFAGRPYVHALAQDQIDRLLSEAVDQIPAAAVLLPAGTVPVREKALNNLIVLNSAPSDPVQNVQIHITPGGIRMDFQAYGFPCTVTGVPQVVNGQVMITHVTVDGIVALIMSPEEVTSLVNRHLADAQSRFRHTITGIRLKNQELDLLVGPPVLSSPSSVGA